ncbi:hypothetical protein ACFOHS_22760 [Jhaorihella thermophila]
MVWTAEPDDALRQILTVIWPGLRRLCLDEIRRSQAGLPDEAMLWLVQRKVNASVLVLDENCNLLQTNAAGGRSDQAGRPAAGVGGAAVQRE